MKRLTLLIGAASLLACNTAGACSDACRASGLQFASWDGKTCTCLTPPRCELEQRAADVTMTRAEVGVMLLKGCSEALAVCRAGGGR